MRQPFMTHFGMGIGAVVVLMFSVGIASAGDPVAPPPSSSDPGIATKPEYLLLGNPPPSSPSVDCVKPTMTPDQFVDIVHTIAMHGDLRDVAFVEKTLQQKLLSQYATGGDNPDTHWIMYRTDPQSNAPFGVLYNVHDDADADSPYAGRRSLASIDFYPPIFKNCQHLTREIVKSHFSGKMTDSIMVNDAPFISEGITFTVNRAKLGVGYVYKPDNSISELSLGQDK